MTEQQKDYDDISTLIGQRLRTRATDAVVFDSENHLDADTVAAFVEGRVAEPGASQITSHLITCSVCRIATARTMHLECAVPAEDNVEEPDASPGRLRKFLDDFAAQVFPSAEEVVFAYEEPSSEQKPATTQTREGDTPAAESESENKNRS